MTLEQGMSEERGLELASSRRNPAAIYLVGLASQSSRETMLTALTKVARLAGADDAFAVDWGAMRFQDVAALRSLLLETRAPATVNKTLAALRGVAKAAWELGLMTADDRLRIQEVKNVKSERLPAGRHVPQGELAALLEVCSTDPAPAGARDAAIIAILYSGGLRRAELVALDVGDYGRQEGRLRVRGKGRKERLVPLADGANLALGDWLELRGVDAGPLFWAINRGGRLIPGRLSAGAIHVALAKRACQARVPRLTPHDLRRTFVGDLLDAGADISTVQHLVGHANVNTTARYDRRPEEVKRKAVELLHVPYRGRGEQAE